MKLLKSCCCCCCCVSLKKGTFIIGCVDLIGSSIFFICCLVIVILSNIEEYKSELEGFTPYRKEIIIYAAEASISMITSILLLIGANKENMWLLMSWIASTKLEIITSIVNGVVTLTTNRGNVNEKLSGGMIIIILILMMQIYPLIVVLSLFRELKTKNQEQATNISSYHLLMNDDSLDVAQLQNEDDFVAVVTN